MSLPIIRISSSSSSSSKPSNTANTKVVAMKHKINALLQERDAQIAALSSEVESLTNQLVYLNAQQHHRKQPKAKKKALVTYGAVVQVQEAECDPKKGGRRSLRGRPNLSLKRTYLGRNASICTAQALLLRQPHSAQDRTRMMVNDTDTATNNDPAAAAAAMEDVVDEDLSWIPTKKGRIQVKQITDRILTMFKDPSDNMKYLQSSTFASDLIALNHYMKKLLVQEPRCIFLQSPCYVFGDIHGNLEDLHFFSDNIWRLGMALTAGNFVFLGDYVDRGRNCLEVVAYLHAMKILLPHKVTLLRGNHETRDVNGWEEHYGPRSFLSQCNERFGEQLGYNVWESTNQVFDRMPLAAVIDQDIFCVHGGIPRPIRTSTNSTPQHTHNNTKEEDDEDDENFNNINNSSSNNHNHHHSRIQDILRVPSVSGINPPYEHEPCLLQRVASDCIWSDPASSEQERTCVDPNTGFGESLRGGGAICFGHKAVTDFLEQQGYSYIMRAHEAHAQGVAVSKGARVFTVFSTSKDHNQGDGAMAGCMLVDHEKLQVINRSPAYKNQYIHRRDSISLQALSEKEINQRIKLGLITLSEEEEEEDEEDDDLQNKEEEQWETIVDDDEAEEEDDNRMEYIFDTRRASMVESWNTVPSPERRGGKKQEEEEDTGFLPQKLAALHEEEEEEDIDEEDTIDGEAELAMQPNGSTWTFSSTTKTPTIAGRHQRVLNARREYNREDF